jgi:hypothetical protein
MWNSLHQIPRMLFLTFLLQNLHKLYDKIPSVYIIFTKHGLDTHAYISIRKYRHLNFQAQTQVRTTGWNRFMVHLSGGGGGNISDDGRGGGDTITNNNPLIRLLLI